jgi:hypothetical protein
MNHRNDGRFAGNLGYSNVSRQQGGFTPTRSNNFCHLDFR